MRRSAGNGHAPAWSRRLLWALIALGLGTAGAGCKRGETTTPAPLPVRVVRVQIEPGEDWAGLGAAALSAAELADAAREGLARAGVHIEPAPPKPEPGDFTLQMELALKRVAPKSKTAGAGPERLRALAAGQLRARSEASALAYEAAVAARQAPELSRLQHVGVIERPTAGSAEADAAAWGQLARRAVGESAHTLGAQLQLLGSPAARLLTVVADTKADSDVRGLAAQLLALRHEGTAVPALIALIKEKELAPALRDQAIGALVELGDRRAVRPLLDSVQFNDELEMGKVVEAVAALGGDEARSYLQFVIASHGDARIKREAQAALTHLEQREQRRDAATP